MPRQLGLWRLAAPSLNPAGSQRRLRAWAQGSGRGRGGDAGACAGPAGSASSAGVMRSGGIRSLPGNRPRSSSALRSRHWPTGSLPRWTFSDPDPLQAPHLIVEDLAHAADLSVETLCQDDAEDIAAFGANHAGLGQCVQNLNARTHALDEIRRQRPIHRDDVLLLVIVLGPQNLVDDIAIVGQQDQALPKACRDGRSGRCARHGR